jgi:hypothetical protein
LSKSTVRPQVFAANSIVNGSRLFLYSSRAVDPLGEKFLFLEAVVQDVAGDGANPHEVSPRLWLKEEIGAFRHLVLAQISYDQFLSAACGPA